MSVKRIYIIMTVVSIMLFICLAVSVSGLSARLKQTPGEPSISTAETVYVYNENDETSLSTTEEHWIVKAYNEKIGIFNPDGELVEIIDTYIKSLPGKDQALLREGFEVNSKKELYSVIEAYSD